MCSFVVQEEGGKLTVREVKNILKKNDLRKKIGYIIAFLYNLFCIFAIAMFSATRERVKNSLHLV